MLFSRYILLLGCVARSVCALKLIVQLANETSVESMMSGYLLDTSVEVFTLGEGFKALSGDFDAAVVRKLFYDAQVVSISTDESMQVQEYIMQNNAPSHLTKLASSSPTSHQPYMYHSHAGIGVDVYVFDSGIDSKHPNLQRVNTIKLLDLTQDIAPEGVDAYGHGTAMAGVIASETFGVLKKCNLIDIRIVEKDGSVRLSTLLRALSVAGNHVKLTERPSVFMIPLIMSKKNAILNSAIEHVPREIAVVLPAGNQKRNACNFSPVSSHKNPNILVLGSLDQNDAPAPFTNDGKCVDLFTSGLGVITLSPTDLSQSSLIREINGTSVSCAIGSGVVGYYMSLGLSSTDAIQKVKDISYSRGGMEKTYKVLQLKP